MRPRGATGHKLNMAWLGPAKVLARIGNSTYRVQIKPGRTQEVHLDQIKPHVADSITGRSYDLYHHQGGQEVLGVEPTEWEVKEVLRHRKGRGGQWESLTHWEGYDVKEATWEPVGHFIHRYSHPWAT